MGTKRQHTALIDEAAPPVTAERTMRAIVQDRYGSAGVLRLARITRPESAIMMCCCRCTQPAWTGAPGT